MKPLSLLLFTIVTRGDFGKAAPTQTGLEKRIDNEGDFFPVLTTRVLAPQATSFQFRRSQNWINDAQVKKDKPAQAVLEKMHEMGLFTTVILRGAQSSVVGAKEGLTTPEEFLKIKENTLGNAFITNGGFFVTGTDKDLVSDFKDGKKGTPLPPDKYKGYSVGPTSLTKNTMDLPSVHADLYERNERNVLVIVDANTKIVCAYTSSRQNGMTINEMRDLIGEFLQGYLKGKGGKNGKTGKKDKNDMKGKKVEETKSKKIEDMKIALNPDGGGSVFVGWMQNGAIEVLATGNLANPTQEPEHLKFRAVTTMIKHSVWVARASKTGESLNEYLSGTPAIT